MSTIIALKLNDTTVLATDSLLYDLQHRVLSNHQQKIHEVSPGVFYAWTGSRYLATNQANIATTLSRMGPPRNLCAFAKELNAASLPCIAQEANYSLTERGQPTVSGELPFFTYILAGVSEGVPGFLVCEFSLSNGKVNREITCCFEPTVGSYITGDKSLIPIIANPKSWEGGLSKAAERFVDHLRLVQPTYVGGPTQMVRVDKSGARWVHEPVELHHEGTVDGGSGGVQARLLSGSPLSTDTSGNLIVKQGAGVGTDGSGNLVVKTSATIGTDGSGNVIIPALAVQTANLAAGSLGDLSKYSSTVRAVTIVFSLPSLPSPSYPQGALIFNTADGKAYRNTGGGLGSCSVTYVGSGYTQSSAYALVSGGGGSGASVTVTVNSSGNVVAVNVANPGTGYTSVPSITIYGGSGAGATATVTSGSGQWTAGTGVQDLFAGTLGASVVYAGTVAAANVVAGSLYGFTISGSTMQLNLYGVTTMLGNVYDSGVSSYVGIKVSDNSSTGYSSLSAHGIWQTDNAGNTGNLANGVLALQAAGGSYITLSPYFLQMPGLPSYNPGTGTKQFWYDPSDSNRVKFAA